MMNDADPFIALGQSKEVAFRVCAKARQAILADTPTTLEPSYWLLVLPCSRTETASLPPSSSVASPLVLSPGASTLMVQSA